MALNTLLLSQDALDWMRSALTETFVLPNEEAGDSAYNYRELEKSGWIEYRSFYVFSITAQIYQPPTPMKTH